MKNLTPFPAKGNTSLLKRLLLTLAFLIPVLTGSLTTQTEVKAQTSTTYDCGVTDDEVVKYLNKNGYIVYRLDPEPGTCNKIATTQYSYQTIVYISNGCIVGFEDIAP